MSLATLSRRSCRLLASLLLSVPLVAQASFTTFGSGCLSVGLSANNLPQIGTTFFLDYTGSFGNQFLGFYGYVNQPVLLLGTSNTQTGGIALPAALPTTMTAGLACDLLVSPDVTMVLPLSTTPPLGLPIAIPATAGLVGFTFHAQWLLLSERSYFGQFQWLRTYTSNGGTAVVGI